MLSESLRGHGSSVIGTETNASASARSITGVSGVLTIAEFSSMKDFTSKQHISTSFVASPFVNLTSPSLTYNRIEPAPIQEMIPHDDL